MNGPRLDLSNDYDRAREGLETQEKDTTDKGGIPDEQDDHLLPTRGTNDQESPYDEKAVSAEINKNPSDY